MARYMTKKQVVAMFKDHVMPMVRQTYEQDGKPDWPARREAWNNMTDSLAKDGDITWNQCENWTQPRICGA